MNNLNELITLDFETYFDSKYSLRAKKYNTSSYVRDPQFEAQICSIKYGKKKAKNYYGAGLERELKAIDWKGHDLLCHHTHFDGLILAHHYGIVPRQYYCTLSMSRALHSEYASKSLGEIGKLYGLGGKYEEGEVLDKVKGKHLAEIVQDKVLFSSFQKYCDRDTNLTYDIFMEQIKVFPEEELRLIDLTIRMFTTPIFQLDIPRCEKALDEAVRERQTGIAIGLHQINSSDEKDLTSNQRFVQALKSLGVDAPTKVSKYNGEITYALSENDEDFVALLEHEDTRVVRLVQGRLAAKSTISETRAARLLQAGENNIPVPVYLNYYGAKTGRWSGGNKLNFQNFPRGSELRKSLVAPDGHVIVVCDSAQIEARGVNWVANNQRVLKVFANKEDVYSYTASDIYGRKIDKKKDPDERFIGKIATLGLGYGMGAAKFQTTLALGTMGPAVDMPLAECDKIVKKFRNANKPITDFWSDMNGVLRRMASGEEGEYGCLSYDADGIWLPNGMGILYPGLTMTTDENNRTSFKYWSKTHWSKLYGGLVTENIVQALAGVIIRQQMLWYADWLKAQKLRKGERAMIATMTHDEIVSVVPERLAEKAMQKKLEVMRTAPDWCSDLPLDAEGGYAKEYSK